MSRLVDRNPDEVLGAAFNQMNAKSLKLLQMFETAVPRREEKLRNLEYSDQILKEIRDREEKALPDSAEAAGDK